MKLKSKYEKENLENTVNNSINLMDVCRNLNMPGSCGNRKTLKNYINLYNIDTSHFYTPRPKNRDHYKEKDLYNEILIENSAYTFTTTLKNKLYRLEIKKRECELCGQNEEWRGKKMSLILDHINGIYNDNRLENLRIVCPNCNATLETHCGKNRKKTKAPKNIYVCVCGNETSKENNICFKCASLKQRKVKNRPSLEILINEVTNFGYSKTGLKYGVSDNCIKKWIKQYGETPPRKKKVH